MNWLEELQRVEHKNLAQYLPLLSSLFLAAGSAAEVKGNGVKQRDVNLMSFSHFV
jgi:hypothetical protein